MSIDAHQMPAGYLVGWPGLFTAEELDLIEAHGASLTPAKAELAGRKDNVDHLRVTRVAWIDRDHRTKWLYARIEQAVLELNRRLYRFDLYGLSESFQYTVYESSEGGHYDWHCDIGATAEPRKISLTLQLSEPDAYEGGDLLLEGGTGSPMRAQKTRGSLVAFPSYMMHRVTPVTAGTRKSLVVWVAGPPFR